MTATPLTPQWARRACLLTLTLLAVTCAADAAGYRITLKSGRVLEAASYQETGDRVVVHLASGQVTLRKDAIREITPLSDAPGKGDRKAPADAPTADQPSITVLLGRNFGSEMAYLLATLPKEPDPAIAKLDEKIREFESYRPRLEALLPDLERKQAAALADEAKAAGRAETLGHAHLKAAVHHAGVTARNLDKARFQIQALKQAIERAEQKKSALKEGD